MKLLLSLVFLISCSSLDNKPIILPPGQKFLVKPYGKIHRSCLNNFGSKLLTTIDGSVKEGLACLSKLKGSAAQKNRIKLEALFKSGKLTFICHEKNYHWEKAIAHGSFDKSFNIPELDAYHPYVSIKPDMVFMDSSYKGESFHPDYVKEILFHEYFHDIGYSHISQPEYAYTCEACCFKSDGASDLACKLCETDYGTISSEKYLKDLWDWSERSRFKKHIYFQTVMRSALVQAKGKPDFLSYMSYKSAHKDPIIVALMAEALRRGYKLDVRAIEVAKSQVEVSPSLRTLVKEAILAQKKLYLERKPRAAADILLKLKTGPLKAALDSKSEDSLLIWETILYDLGYLRTYFWKDNYESRLNTMLEEIKAFRSE